jgi:hypothetical protein
MVEARARSCQLLRVVKPSDMASLDALVIAG